MGLETVACYTLVSPHYEFMDHNFVGYYRILVVFKRHYYIYLKFIKDIINNDFIIKRDNHVQGIK